MRALILGVIPLVVGCTSGASAPLPASDLQMNDLSVLLPLAQTQAELDADLAPTAPALGGPLFPATVYTTAGGGAYDDLHVVAFRLDPCFGQLGTITDPSMCQAQLRVVFQPMFAQTDGPVVADDMAVHAFYALTADQLIDATNDMMTARHDDNGDADLGPLAPNPVVVREGLGGPLAQRFDAIIVKYAGAANLIRFTTLQIEELFAGSGSSPTDFGEVWQMQGLDVANGVATPKVIPTLPAAATTMSFQAGTSPLSATFSPMTTSNDNIALLANFAQANQATAAARQAAFDSALRIENPHDNSPNTIDCASCHMAEPARQLVGEQLGMTSVGDANAFVPDAAIPAADLVETTQLVGSDGVLNIHAFSYRNSAPMINQRVINETAANLTYISTLLQ